MKHPSIHSIDLFVAETIYVSDILFISDKYIMINVASVVLHC